MDTKLEHIASSPSLAMAQPAQDLRFFAMSTGQGTQRLTPAGRPRGESAQTIFEAHEEQTLHQKYRSVLQFQFILLSTNKIISPNLPKFDHQKKKLESKDSLISLVDDDACWAHLDYASD